MKKSIAIIMASLVLLGGCQVTKNTAGTAAPGQGKVKVVAHRGYHPTADYPENSIAALRYAQWLGVYGSEFDVWQTADGELYVNHDASFKGVNIAKSTSKVVGNLTLSNGEKMPTLRQYLEQGKKAPSVKLILELKHYQATDKSVALVKEMGMEKQVEWIAFSYDACKRVHELLPDAIVQYLNGDKSPSEVFADGIIGIDYSSSALKKHPEWILEAHKKGMIVNVWTVNSDFKYWIDLGVDVITTNESDALLTLLKQKK